MTKTTNTKASMNHRKDDNNKKDKEDYDSEWSLSNAGEDDEMDEDADGDGDDSSGKVGVINNNAENIARSNSNKQEESMDQFIDRAFKAMGRRMPSKRIMMKYPVQESTDELVLLVKQYLIDAGREEDAKNLK